MNKKYKFAFFIFLMVVAISTGLIYLNSDKIALLSPKGMIALKERNLILLSTLLMLIVVIPVLVMIPIFSWKFRASNKKALYAPDWDYSFLAEALWWGFPTLIVIVLSYLTWVSSHELDPYKPIVSNKKPLKIQVVALQWNWLFIYPEQQIAALNFLQFPEDTPINFEITSDAPMNSFWIPQLGGQVYAMPGMKTQLHLIADEVGHYRGSSSNISGKGFAGMTFVAHSTSEGDFETWIKEVKQSGKDLSFLEYNELAKPSENTPISFYNLKDGNLFDRIVMKFLVPTPPK